MQTYDMDSAQRIIGEGSCSDLVRFEEAGVFPRIETGVSTAAETNILQWMPACELDGPDVPDLLKTPSLPTPFTANELAAFMLDGAGWFLLEKYGGWHGGPDEKELESMGLLANRAKEAVRDAYKAYRVAESVVGKFDQETAAHAHQLEQEYRQKKHEANKKEGVPAVYHTWDEQGKPRPSAADGKERITDEEYWARRARAKASVADLLEALMDALQKADAEAAKWRKAMVRQLLPPKTDTNTQVAPAGSTATDPAPVSRKRWTPEFTADVQVFRDENGLTKTALRYGANISLITRQTKPKTPKQKAANFVSGLIREIR
jgi:hypothetical protein